MGNTAHKNTRIDFRIKSDQKELLSYAASTQNMTLSAFIITSALKEAEEIVSEKIQFSLSQKQWKAFCDRLEQPAKSIAKLKKLFSKPSVFDE